MDNDVKVLERIYDRFNARDIEGVLTVLTDDVAWYGWWPRPWPRGRTRVLDAPVDHGQSARRACGLSSNCGWRDHRRSLAVRPRSRRQAAPGAEARAHRQDGRTRFPSPRGEGGSLRHPGCPLRSWRRGNLAASHSGI